MPLIYTVYVVSTQALSVSVPDIYLFLDRNVFFFCYGLLNCLFYSLDLSHALLYFTDISKKHYCSKQKTNKFVQHYTFLWFIFFFRFKEDRGTFEFPCLYLFSVNSLILISLSVFYVVDLSSFSNLNSYVVLMLVFSYLQSCYLFEITWPRVCVKLTNLYLPESIHLFQVFFFG